MSPRAGLNKSLVVQTAADLVNAEGLEALSITRLADILGVRAPSIYNHISGLDDLRRELAISGLRELGDRMAEAAMGRSGEDALLAVAQAYRAFIKEAPGVYTAGLRSSGRLLAADPEQQAAETRILKIVMTIIDSFQLKDTDAIHAARALRSLVHGFTTLEIAGGFGLPYNLDESFERLVRLLVNGLRRKSQQD